MTARAIAALLLAAFAAAVSVHGWVPLTLPGTVGVNAGSVTRWDLGIYPDGRIPYLVNPTQPAGAVPIAPAGTTEADLIRRVYESFLTFEAVQGSEVRFRYQGTTSATNGFDGSNVVTFSPVGFSFPPAFPGGIFPLIFSAMDAGTVTAPGGMVFTANFPGQVMEVDVVVNPQGDFTIDDSGPPAGTTFHMPGVLVHEISHALGFDHDGIGTGTMYGFFTTGGGFFNRELDIGDRVGVASFYPTPEFVASTGTISGRVMRADGSPVFGAHVVVADPDGNVVSSTVSGASATDAIGYPSAYSDNNGNFWFVGLPPGRYSVHVEPLDGPGLPFMSGVFGTGSGGASFIDTDFEATTVAADVTVAAGREQSGIDITVPARTGASPNLAADVFMLNSAGTAFVTPVRVEPNSTTTISISGENIQTATELLPNTQIDVSGENVTLATTQVRATDVLMSLTVGNAIPGSRTLSLRNDEGLSVFSGALEVVRPLDTNVVLVSSVLPAGRSVQVDALATLFASMINAGTSAAVGCRITPVTPTLADFFFQETDALNVPVGTRDAPVNIAPGATQSFVMGFTPSAAFDTSVVELRFGCESAVDATVVEGLNTVLLSASDSPIADMVALAATVNQDGIVHIPGATGTGFFTVASVNVGAQDTISVTADTGAATLPVTVTLCQTDPLTSACINPTSPGAGPMSVDVEQNGTPTFAVFVTGTEAIAFDPAFKRIFVRFAEDGSGVVRGATSVAVQTDI